MMSPIHALAAAATAAAGFAATPERLAEVLQQQGYVHVALRDSGVGHLYARGTLNGRAVDVLVDTGASNTVIDADLAAEMKLATTPSPQAGAGIGAARVTASTVTGADLTIGGVRVTQPLYTMDMTHLRAALAQRGVAAPSVVLGGDALRALHGVLLYSSGALYLLRR